MSALPWAEVSQHQAEEALVWAALQRAEDDTEAFIECYAPHVKHPKLGLIPFVPYEKQRAYIRDLDAGLSALAFKSRQTGVTTATMIVVLRMCQKPGRTFLIVSATEKLAAELLEKVRVALRSLRIPFPSKVVKDNTLELAFENGSTIQGIAPTQEGGRSYAASFVLLDEVRALPWPRETWKSLAPTATHGGQLVMVSTPDLEGSFFHEHWLSVSTGASSWAYHVLHWRDWPGRDDAWAERTRKDLELTALDWAQEYELEWGKIGACIFSPESIDLALSLGAQAVLLGESHAMGADVAKGGSGRDSSVSTCLDTSTEPFVLVENEDLGERSAPSLQAELSRRARERNAKPWVDCTGIGWGIVGNLEVDAVGVNFTSGTAVTGKEPEYNVPRRKLMSNLALGLEGGRLAIDGKQFPEVVVALRTAQEEKKKGTFVDHLDSLALAFWSATQYSPPQKAWWRDAHTLDWMKQVAQPAEAKRGAS